MSGFSNVKNAVPDVPSRDFVNFTNGTEVSFRSRTNEMETSHLICNVEDDVDEDDDDLLPLLIRRRLVSVATLFDCFFECSDCCSAIDVIA